MPAFPLPLTLVGTRWRDATAFKHLHAIQTASFNPSLNTVTTLESLFFFSHNFFVSPADLLNSSITGGYVYRGTGVPDLSGLYVYADYGSGAIFGISASRAATTSDCGLTSDILVETNFAISTFGVIGGELYFADLRSSGGLYTFSTAGSTASASVLPSPSKSPTGLPSFPTTLSKSTSVPGVATIEVYFYFLFPAISFAHCRLPVPT